MDKLNLYLSYHRSKDYFDRVCIAKEIISIKNSTPDISYFSEEVWSSLNVPFYDHYYMISNRGILKRLARKVSYRNGNPKNWPEKILPPSFTEDGRLRFNLYVDNKQSRIFVHRAVALTFIENPLNKPCVNHIDGDPKNCHYLNLEWMTHSENERHSFDVLGKKVVIPNGIQNHNWKGRMARLGTDGKPEKIYDCAKDVSNDGFHVSHVYRVANGARKTTGGFAWIWV